MLMRQHNHQSIYIRNFLTIFICISFLAFINYQLNSQNQYLTQTNKLVQAMINNQTSQLSEQTIQFLRSKMHEKQYKQFSQSQCMAKIYLDVFKNQKFLKQSQQKQSESIQKIQHPVLNAPTPDKDLQNLQNCGDIITMMNFLNPNRIDFIYTNYIQEKYGTLNKEEDQNTQKFCLLVNQFNTSLTKLRSNLKSLTQQSYENMKLVILDNGSGDGSYQIAKIFLQDLKERLIKQDPDKKRDIQKKYLIFKEQSHLNEFQLYKKYQSQCQETHYIITIDGRDQLISRHVLSILNNQISKKKQKPSFISGSILEKKYLSKLLAPRVQEDITLPKFVFRVISKSLYQSTKQIISFEVKQLNSPFEINYKINEVLFQQAKKDPQSILILDQMLYAYDAIENDRNEYLIKSIQNQIQKFKTTKK